MDSQLTRWATPRQLELMQAVKEHGSARAAAKALGLSHDSVSKAVRRVQRRAARAGYSPDHDMTHTAPDGFLVKGVSTLYDADGQPKAQWVKTTATADEEREAFDEMVAAIAEPLRGKSSAPKRGKVAPSASLLSVYVIGDHHLGMRSWPEETGDSWDTEIAERVLCDAVDHLVSLTPDSDDALIVNVGDFVHTDNSENRTDKSGHALDVDTRWPLLFRVAVRAMKRCIELALTKHARVRVINAQGNHDERTSIALSVCLAEFYANDSRVTIETGADPFKYVQFGENLIGVTHGHKMKASELPAIMASDKPREWGASKHRRWITGHVHHDQTKEYRGCVVETFRTLAAKDSWHHGQGYRSGRDMKCLVLHREHGERVRHTVGIGALNAA